MVRGERKKKKKHEAKKRGEIPFSCPVFSLVNFSPAP